MTTKALPAALVGLLMTGCAAMTPQQQSLCAEQGGKVARFNEGCLPPLVELVVDPHPGFDEGQYVLDRKECSTYMARVKKPGLGEALAVAMMGAAAGYAVGTASGLGSDLSGSIAGGTGVASGITYQAKTQQQYNAMRKAVLRNCMVGRGYNVLN